MGYSYMQYSGGPFEPERIARVSSAVGLPVCLTHVPYDRIVGDTERLMDEHELFNCKNIGLGMLPMEKMVEQVAELNEAGEKMAKRGFKFFYHHHHYEFLKHGEKTVFDYIIDEAPFVNFTLDTYWLQYGGVDIMKTLDRLAGRIECVHLKDYKIEYDKEKEQLLPTFAPCGKGTLDFPKITEKMATLGVKYYLVEQDNAPQRPDPLGEIKTSADYLKEI